jgi:uncharacterized protein
MNINTNRASYQFLPQLGILVNSEIVGELSHLFPNPIEEKQIMANLKKELTDEEIEERISSIRNITFNITEQCNFRCGYCVYSGNYDVVRKHSSRKLSLDTAKKAVDKLLKWVQLKRRTIKTRSINIGFYGGEALLEFQLIDEIIKYTKLKFSSQRIKGKFDVEFRLNTNGYLLTDHVIKFLVENNITLDVSMDGPKEEHDKFRLTKKGLNTWDTIWDNLQRLKKNYPVYYANNVNFLITLHPFHDYERIDRFFIENPDFFNLEKVSAYFLNRLFLKEGIKKQLQEEVESQSCRIARIKYFERLDDKLRLKTLNNDSHFTAMCFPGEAKLFVTVDGSLHICERIKPNIPIGDVDKGIDYDAIRNVYRQWNAEIIRNRCWECIAWSYCNVCLSHSEDETGSKIDCTLKNQTETALVDYLNFKEEAQFEGIDFKPESMNVKAYIGML